MQINGSQKEGKGDNKESGRRGYTDQRRAEKRPIARRRRTRATIKRVGAEAVQINGPQKEDTGDNKESGRRGCIDQRPAAGIEGRQ